MIIIETQAVGPFFKNGFVIACPRTRQGVIIDPGDEVDALLAFAARERIHLTHILLTHAHVDHFGGALGVLSAQDIAQRKVPVIAPEGFVEEATSENVLAGTAMGRRGFP